MSRPVIGISVEGRRDSEDLKTGGTLQLHWNYAQAITDAGGLPILLPPMADPKEIAALLDGFLIPGGLDIDAVQYSEPNDPRSELQDPSRYAFEKALYTALGPEVPILGICYGCQFLNVAQGGSLSQHIPDQLGNDLHSGGTLQEYELTSTSLAAAALGASRVQGKSYHHQAISRLGENVKVVGMSEDGIVEAVEVDNRKWTVGVQWHPERSQHDLPMRELFRSFVQRAAEYRSRR